MRNERNQLIDVLMGVGPESCPKHINLHLHTTCSDGSLSPSKLLDQACEIGLEHIAITDHHSIKAFDSLTSQIQNIKKYTF